MAYGYTDAGDLTSLTDDLAGTANDVTFTNSYSPSHQIVSAAISNSTFAYAPPAAGTDSYGGVNSLNQYTTVTPQCK